MILYILISMFLDSKLEDIDCKPNVSKHSLSFLHERNFYLLEFF